MAVKIRFKAGGPGPNGEPWTPPNGVEVQSGGYYRKFEGTGPWSLNSEDDDVKNLEYQLFSNHKVLEVFDDAAPEPAPVEAPAEAPAKPLGTKKSG